MKENIEKFLKKSRLMVLATSVGDQSYCTPLFYVYYPPKRLLLFSSGKTSRHCIEMGKNPLVSAGIITNEKKLFSLQGAQVTGIVYQAGEEEKKEINNYYYKKMPLALAFMNSEIWAIQIRSIKFTDNTLGFSTKFLWEEGQEG